MFDISFPNLFIIECNSRQLLPNRVFWFMSKDIFDWTTFIFFCNSELCVTIISSVLLSFSSFPSRFTRESWLFLKSSRYPSIFLLVLFISAKSVKVKLFLCKFFHNSTEDFITIRRISDTIPYNYFALFLLSFY